MRSEIPKKIHFVWLGSKMPKHIQRLIASIKKRYPDYQFFFWNEKSFDIKKYDFLNLCMKSGKYAFVADFIRLKVLEQYGGIYLDVDTKIVTDFSNLLDNETVLGFEKDNLVCCSFMATAPHSAYIEGLLKYYDNWKYDESRLTSVTLPDLMTDYTILQYGLERDATKLQILRDVTVYPLDYFSVPSDDSRVIHLFWASWTGGTFKERIRKYAGYKLRYFSSNKFIRRIYRWQFEVRNQI